MHKQIYINKYCTFINNLFNMKIYLYYNIDKNTNEIKKKKTVNSFSVINHYEESRKQLKGKKAQNLRITRTTIKIIKGDNYTYNQFLNKMLRP